MVWMLILGFLLCAIGLYMFYAKYRVVCGGTRCMAHVKRYEWACSSRGINAYRYIVAFEFEGNVLERPTLDSTIRPGRAGGGPMCVFFNPRYPHVVVRCGGDIQWTAAALLLLGVALVVLVLCLR